MRRLVAPALVLFALPALATPVSVSHAGYLLSASDLPLEQTGVAFTFRLVDASDALLWQASCALDVKGGYYATTLGQAPCAGTTTLDTTAIPADAARWLEVTVGSTTLSPKVRLDPAPGASVAADAAKLGGIAANAYALKTDTAPDSTKLGGVAANAYALKTDTAPNALKLGGVDASTLLDGAGKVQASALPSTVAYLSSGALPVTAGGTGLTSAGTPNQLLGRNGLAGSGLEYKNLIAGANISITQAAGDITIASTGTITATNVVTRTTAAQTVYVDPAGHDTLCDGSTAATLAAAQGSGTAPACALATPQAGLNALPDLLLHGTTVSLAAGTYRVTASGEILLDVRKALGKGGSLTIRGNGVVELSGATAAAPTTNAGGTGIFVRNATEVTLRDVTVSRFGTGIIVESGAVAGLNTVNATLCTGSGFFQNKGSRAFMVGTNTFSGNGTGVDVAGRLDTVAGATVTTNANTNTNLNAWLGGVIVHNGGATLNVTGSVNGTGVVLGDGAVLYSAGTVNITGNHTDGLAAHRNSTFAADGPGVVTVSSNGSVGLSIFNNSMLHLSAPFVASGNGVHAINVTNHSTGEVYGTVNATCAGTGACVNTCQGSWLGFYPGNASSPNMTLTGTSATSGLAFNACHASTLYFGGANLSVTKFNQVFEIWGNSLMQDDNPGGSPPPVRAFSLFTTKAVLDFGSTWVKGGMGTVSTCNTGSYCQP